MCPNQGGETAARVIRPDKPTVGTAQEIVVVTLSQALHTLSLITAGRVEGLEKEEGASAVEYAIVVGIIAAVVVAVVTLWGVR